MFKNTHQTSDIVLTMVVTLTQQNIIMKLITDYWFVHIAAFCVIAMLYMSYNPSAN